MRIIAGEFRGRSIESVRDLSVRPTTDRAKQTILDILSNRIEFDGLDVLDLFAGRLTSIVNATKLSEEDMKVKKDQIVAQTEKDNAIKRHYTLLNENLIAENQ